MAQTHFKQNGSGCLLLRLWLLTSLSVSAWPASWGCDYTCLAGKTPGSSFGPMGIAKIETDTSLHCKITTDIPSAGYAQGQSYVITVTSQLELGVRLGSDRAGFGGFDKQVDNWWQKGGGKKSTHAFTATGDATASFVAVCGAGGGVRKVWLGAAVTVNKDASAKAVTTVTTTAKPTTAGTVVKQGALKNSVELKPGMTMGASVVNKDIEMSVTSDKGSWVAIGFSGGSTLSMDNGGKGVEMICCTDGQVKRYWVTAKVTPAGGSVVAGSTCSHISGKTIMRFKRPLAAANAKEVAITPGTAQVLIFAHGASSSSTAFSYHNDDKGGTKIDFATLATSEADKKSAEAVLWLHLICMVLSWGGLLPWGVVLANRIRKVADMPPGRWFILHRRFQVVGWCVQLIGFVFILVHVSNTSGKHFDNGHAILGLIVIVLGTQQPFNASLRHLCAHPHAGEPKTTGRRVFEIFHKGGGYLSVVFGLLNCWFGVWQLSEKLYNSTVIIVASIFAAFGTLPVIAYFVISLVDPNNRLSRMIAGVTGKVELGDGSPVGKPE